MISNHLAIYNVDLIIMVLISIEQPVHQGCPPSADPSAQSQPPHIKPRKYLFQDDHDCDEALYHINDCNDYDELLEK